ncbi:hypothetical protein CHF27_000415 [Romboutsia maritimum]|uniref:DUF8052 domain-containing protein n=1 Tax=Romboutsia maritimum TaxID=2020948 RepID=A0A371IW46_9FIRM|nr:hypothetical protein CHF27_000415 [Romboutsia maritimum]
MGEFILSNSKYFLSRQKVIWSYDNKEYIFVKSLQNISLNDFDNFIFPFSNFALNNVVNINENHMSTYVTLFLTSPNIDLELSSLIKKFKKRRSYKFGLRGYSNFRIILFNTLTKEFFYNKDSKDIINFYKEVLL